MFLEYEELLKMAKVQDWDRERQAFFYIISNNEELSERIDQIYDFEGNGLRIYEEQENGIGKNLIGDFTGELGFMQMGSTAKRLLRVAVALYNGRECDLFNTFGYIDQELYTMVSKAIEIRFNFLNVQELKNQNRRNEEIGKYKMQIMELINENRKDLKKLNISKICRILEINRTTFYNYELDKFFKNMISDLER